MMMWTGKAVLKTCLVIRKNVTDFEMYTNAQKSFSLQWKKHSSVQDLSK